MAESNQYVDAIEPIWNEGKKIGIGFIVKEDEEHSWLLTCQHVVFDGTAYKTSLKIRDKAIKEEDITLANGIDLALIKVSRLSDKKPYFLHEHVRDDALIISTYSNIDSTKRSFIHENINATIKTKTSLHHGRNYDAFELCVEEPLESGYSGSPLFDSNTEHIIGVVSVKEGEDRGYAIDIKYVTELMEDIEVSKLPDNMNKEFREERARVVFDHQGEDRYKIRIHQTELFDGNTVDVVEKKEELIDEIQRYRRYLPTGEERVLEIEMVELVIPHLLFHEDIGLWEDGEGEMLIEESQVLIRHLDRANQSNLKKEANKTLWREALTSTQSFKEQSVKVNNSVFIKDSHKLSAYLDSVSSSSTPFKKVALHSNIFIWINECAEVEHYQTFLEQLFGQTLEAFPSKFREALAISTNSCAFHANLMWDDPTTLPKAYYE
jgi:hypothetical protein